jgi:hypothetical protein
VFGFVGASHIWNHFLVIGAAAATVRSRSTSARILTTVSIVRGKLNFEVGGRMDRGLGEEVDARLAMSLNRVSFASMSMSMSLL